MSGMANTSVKRMARHLFKMTRDLAAPQRREVNEKIKDHFRTNKMADPEARCAPLVFALFFLYSLVGGGAAAAAAAAAAVFDLL